MAWRWPCRSARRLDEVGKAAISRNVFCSASSRRSSPAAGRSSPLNRAIIGSAATGAAGPTTRMDNSSAIWRGLACTRNRRGSCLGRRSTRLAEDGDGRSGRGEAGPRRATQSRTTGQWRPVKVRRSSPSRRALGRAHPRGIARSRGRAIDCGRRHNWLCVRPWTLPSLAACRGAPRRPVKSAPGTGDGDVAAG